MYHLAKEAIVGVPGGSPARPAAYITTLMIINHYCPVIYTYFNDNYNQFYLP